MLFLFAEGMEPTIFLLFSYPLTILPLLDYLFCFFRLSGVIK